jgi:hypothetical protein
MLKHTNASGQLLAICHYLEKGSTSLLTSFYLCYEITMLPWAWALKYKLLYGAP